MKRSPLRFVRMDTDRFFNIRIRMLRHKHGCAGFCVYEYALTEIYRDKGCYLEWTDESAFGMAEYWGLTVAEVQEIVGTCAELGLFDAEQLEGGVLTSASIQARYVEMCRASKRRAFIPPDVCLLGDTSFSEETAKTPEETAKTPEETQKTPEISGFKNKFKRKPPTGVKENPRPPEVGKVKLWERPAPPSRDEVQKFFSEEAGRRAPKMGVELDADKWEDFWLYYEQKEWHDGGGMNICGTWRSAATRWIIEELRREKKKQNHNDYGQARNAARRGVDPTGSEQYRDTL